MVLQDFGELVVGNGDVTGGEALESVVVGAEDCDVREVFEGSDKVCLGGGASEGGEISCDEGGGDAEGDEEEFVDDVDYTVVEFEILVWVISLVDIGSVRESDKLTGTTTWLVDLTPLVTIALPSSSRFTETTCPPVTLLPLTSPSSTKPE